ncbi:hypothetical protein BaRGS_00001084 [Batillaria attramentaria]|uniref:Uncharacterized protein n=1 Tax=Batillaria attramentaria TaxID=370345 RepID=A0ABD0M5X3_9CAEN
MHQDATKAGSAGHHGGVLSRSPINRIMKRSYGWVSVLITPACRRVRRPARTAVGLWRNSWCLRYCPETVASELDKGYVRLG